MIKITLGKVLASLTITVGLMAAISNVTNNQQIALWQFNCVCWAIVALMLEFRLDRIQNEYNDLIDTIFEEYDKQQRDKLNNELDK